jgi:NAD(P) transhydrogenase
MMGGVSVQTGTIPSKTLREAILQLRGLTVTALYGNGSRSRGDIPAQGLSSRVNAIIGREREVVRAQLERNGVAIYQDDALFLDPHSVGIQGDGEELTVKGRPDRGNTNVESSPLRSGSRKILRACKGV